MHLGETIATYDVALALRGESGKFDVTSPMGEIYHVTCRPNDSITNLQLSGNGTNPQPFLIRKVAETVSFPAPEKTSASVTETATQGRPVQTPFLVGTHEGEPVPEDSHMAVPEAPKSGEEMGEVFILDLLYEEVEPKTQQATAWLCLRSDLQSGRRRLVTNPCTAFNEFDAEIRRLHAQLDDIRYRARKKFYQAQAIAPGA